MAFNINIYHDLLRMAAVRTSGRHFNEVDIVHDMYLEEKEFTIATAKKAMFGFVRKEESKGVAFILTHKIFDSEYLCSKCKEFKPVACYRLRQESRETFFNYVNDTCSECELKIKKEYDRTHKDNDNYKTKALLRAKKWHIDNRAHRLEYARERRNTDEYKEKRKEYNNANREQIRKKAKEARLRKNATKKAA